jgi:hypothetical protein
MMSFELNINVLAEDDEVIVESHFAPHSLERSHLD